MTDARDALTSCLLPNTRYLVSVTFSIGRQSAVSQADLYSLRLYDMPKRYYAQRKHIISSVSPTYNAA